MNLTGLAFARWTTVTPLQFIYQTLLFPISGFEEEANKTIDNSPFFIVLNGTSINELKQKPSSKTRAVF